MADPLYWDDAYPIALSLRAAYPHVADPTTLDLRLLREWVVQLDGFSDDRDTWSVEWLEQIQAEWVELLAESTESSRYWVVSQTYSRTTGDRRDGECGDG